MLPTLTLLTDLARTQHPWLLAVEAKAKNRMLAFDYDTGAEIEISAEERRIAERYIQQERTGSAARKDVLCGGIRCELEAAQDGARTWRP
jgi:hypothetical protein